MWTLSLTRRKTSWSVLSLVIASAISFSACDEKEEPYVTPGRDMRDSLEDLISNTPSPATKGPRITVEAIRENGSATRSQLGPDGKTLLWTAGDSFQVEFVRNGQYYVAEFSTEDEGVETATFTSESILDGAGYTCIYPEYLESRTSSVTGFRYYFVDLPAEQDAVPGNISSGLNRAMAYSDYLEDGTSLTFYNLPALLCFRLSGSVTSRLKEIQFSAPAHLAGDISFYWNEGVPAIHPRTTLSSHSKITLKGPFTEDTEYYIALWPNEVEGFVMTFSDGEGHSTLLRSSQTITFKRSTVTDFGTIALGDEFIGAPSVSTNPILYHQATAGTKPVTMVVIPDGFQEQELPEYERLAKRGFDLLLDTEPYKSYADRLNLWILKVASAESGASITNGNGTITTRVNDYFGIRWGADSYNDMQGDGTKIFNFVSANCPDIVNGIHTINEVPITIIVNDSRYGGKTWAWDTGKSYCIIPFFSHGSSISWHYPSNSPNSESNPSAGYHRTTNAEFEEVVYGSPGDWRNVMLHELGHSFGRLLDEYWNQYKNANTSRIDRYQNWTLPYGLNISTTYSNPPWQEFLDRREELMALDPNYGRIGVFQGGDTYIFNAWRSERVSGMIDNRQYFTAWDRYLIVKRIMTLSGDLSSFSFDSWLAKDVTIDPLRDLPTRAGFDWTQDPPFPLAGYSAPPGLVEE